MGIRLFYLALVFGALLLAACERECKECPALHINVCNVALDRMLGQAIEDDLAAAVDFDGNGALTPADVGEWVRICNP